MKYLRKFISFDQANNAVLNVSTSILIMKDSSNYVVNIVSCDSTLNEDDRLIITGDSINDYTIEKMKTIKLDYDVLNIGRLS